jgi:23S rRNA-/tRNA-specific pseudouridylate synthase
VLILARTAEAHRSLNTQFERHQVSKVYHALVMGNPEWDEKTVDLPLRSNGDRQHRTVVDQRHGKPATTRLNVVERFGTISLLEAIPETGRTHQIRAHLYAVGLSIVGDVLYRRKLPNQKSESTSKLPASIDPPQFGSAGMGLHAWSLEVNHPHTGERMKFIAPYPGEWAAALQQLRAQS